MERVELKTQEGRVYFTAEYDKTNHWIYTSCYGFLTIENIMEGCEKFLELLSIVKCPNVLNDKRMVQGAWKNINDWLANEWIPRTIEKGLKNFAYVVSPNAVAELSAKDLEAKVENKELTIRTFTDFDNAINWLKLRSKNLQNV